MAITYPQIKLLLVDLTAKEDSTPTSTDKQSFVTVSDIKTKFDPVRYATLEDGQWLFGQNFKILPDDLTTVDWGYWSSSQSNASGVFSTPPVIDVSFSTVHTSNGITIDFWSVTNDYCDDVDISWYDAGDVLIETKNFTPDSFSYFCNNLVENYKRVTITFNSTNKNYRYAKVQNIEYGEVAIFTDANISDADLTEEIDLTTDKITINKIDFALKLDTSERAEEIITVLQNTQQIEVTEFINDVPVTIGTFYVSDKDLEEEKLLRIEGEDLIGQLTNEDFLGGMYTNETVENIVDSIMAVIDTDLYEIDDSLKSLQVSGYLPIQSCKDSLQDVIFAVNGVVDCSRGEKIRIYPLSTATTVLLTRNEVFSYKERDVNKQIKPVTGVKLQLKSYATTTSTVRVYEETVASGTYTVYFNEPVSNLVISGGTITASNVNYATFTTTGGAITIDGYKYEVSINTSTKEKTLPAGVKSNILTFENTITYDIEVQAEYLKDYETQSSTVEIDLITTGVKVGDYITIDGYFGKTFSGFIVSNDTDLANGVRGGMVAYGELV